jgi:hypothetical protein
MRFNALILAAAAAGLAACTTAEGGTQSASAPANRDCFNAASVNGYEIVDEHNIRVRVSTRRTYTMTTSWNANDLDWSNAIALRSTSGWICTGNARGVVEVTGGTFNRTFPIDTITRDPEPPSDQQGS